MSYRILINDFLAKSKATLLNRGKMYRAPLSLTTDTRKTTGKNTFIALRGKKFNGINYLEEAVAKGISTLVVNIDEFTMAPIFKNTTIIGVKDTLRAYGDIAHLARKQFEGDVIAICGSTGKTTTKELLGNILSECYRITATKENFNNLVGVPYTILNIEKDTEKLLLEIATNCKGEIPRLMKISKPDIAIITNIGRSHIGMFKSEQELIDEKMACFRLLGSKGTAIVNLDNPHIVANVDQIKSSHLTFSSKPRNLVPADVNIEQRSIDMAGKVHIEALLGKERHAFQFQHRGFGFAYNVVIALALAHAYHLSPEAIQRGLSKKLRLPLRMEIVKASGNRTYVLDCYNASPESMKNALYAFEELKKEEKGMAILGDILELGDHAKTLHYEVGQTLANLNIEACIAVGQNVEYIIDGAKDGDYQGQLIHYRRKEDLYPDLKKIAKGYSWFLFKASRRMKLEDLLPYMEG